MHQKQVSRKAKHTPNTSFSTSLCRQASPATGRGQPLRHLAPECQPDCQSRRRQASQGACGVASHGGRRTGGPKSIDRENAANWVKIMLQKRNMPQKNAKRLDGRARLLADLKASKPPSSLDERARGCIGRCSPCFFFLRGSPMQDPSGDGDVLQAYQGERIGVGTIPDGDDGRKGRLPQADWMVGLSRPRWRAFSSGFSAGWNDY